MIEAGTSSQIIWGDGNWTFIDIGFSHNKKSCGLIMGESEPERVQFSEAKERIVRAAKNSSSPFNLVIEAPLSVCFNVKGNPTGRSIEKEAGKSPRYWYSGPGCTVMVAAMYLLHGLQNINSAPPVRLFEGFVSYKNRSAPSRHTRDVCLLREVVRDPAKFSGSIFSPERLKQDRSDELFSAFCVAGMDYGVPTVIKRAGS